jgi:hypothetical protein
MRTLLESQVEGSKMEWIYMRVLMKFTDANAVLCVMNRKYCWRRERRCYN